MDIDELKEAIEEQCADDSKIVDNGIGYYEFGSIRAIDKNICLEIQTDKAIIDVTDLELFDDDGELVPVTIQNIIANEGEKFNCSATHSGNGDPDNCAESGRRRCGSCQACDSWSTDFTATIEAVQTKDGKIFTIYNIEE